MASMKEIKRRRSSIQSTKQITKAMKLVSTVKLQKARQRAEKSKPYFMLIYDTIASILTRSTNLEHRYLRKNEGGKAAVITITSNRGLAGGYNNNIIRLTEHSFKKDEVLIYSIGKKGKDALERHGYSIAGDYAEVMNEPLYTDAAEITSVLLKEYEKGGISAIYLAYTNFKNTVVHLPTLIKLLPLSADEMKQSPEEENGTAKSEALMNYSPNEEVVLDAIVPKYISSIIFGALKQAAAAENGARMNAMENATNNADELIEKLSLQYNRARQGAITQELTEIVAGANAIE